jgi:hypothetical protein
LGYWKAVLAHILSIDLENEISGENEVRTSLALGNPDGFHIDNGITYISVLSISFSDVFLRKLICSIRYLLTRILI